MNFWAVINAIVEHTGFLFSKYFFLFLYQVEDKGHANDFNVATFICISMWFFFCVCEFVCMCDISLIAIELTLAAILAQKLSW